MEKEISNKIGSSIKVRFHNHNKTDKEASTAKDSDEDLKKNEEVLNKIVNLFDGEILLGDIMFKGNMSKLLKQARRCKSD